jgi:hypothetical protein
MKRVDLALAVNYVPACVCLCKALVLMLAMSLIPPGEEIRNGYIPLAALLYLDRLVMRNMIFDANAILLALYFANVHAAVRATSPRQAYSILLWGLHLCWVGMCLTLLANPGKVRWLFEKRVQASKLVPVGLMLLVLVGTAFVHAPLESGPIRSCRALAFTLLSFAWIYLVGIHSPQGLEYLKETSCQFVARLAPVLYSPLGVAAFFPLAAIAALVWQFSTHSQPPGEPAVQVVVEQAPAEPSEDDQLHELFRQAKMMGRAGRMEAIVEEQEGAAPLKRT